MKNGENNEFQRLFPNISTTTKWRADALPFTEVIIRRGDMITSETVNILESLNAARSIKASEFERWMRLSGGAILIIIISLVFYLYLSFYIGRKISFS